MSDQIPLVQIRVDGGTQTRVALDEETIAEYGAALKSLPPIVVFYDGAAHWLADGFHRYHAHKRAGAKRVACEVRQGTVRDAILFSVGANASHGMRRTNADKRRAVMTLLRDEEWAKKSDAWIAKACAVTHPFVGKLRAEQQPVTVTGSAMRTGRDGKARNPPKPRSVATRIDTSTSQVEEFDEVAPSTPPPARAALTSRPLLPPAEPERAPDDWDARAARTAAAGEWDETSAIAGLDEALSETWDAWPVGASLLAFEEHLRSWLRRIEAKRKREGTAA